MDLPVWQELREELRPRGLEIVTVALDAGGAATAGPWIAKAAPRHPSPSARELQPYDSIAVRVISAGPLTNQLVVTTLEMRRTLTLARAEEVR